MKILKISTIPQSLNGLLRGQLSFLSAHGFEVVGVSSEGESLEEMSRRENVRIRVVNMERHINPMKDIMSLIRLYHCMKEEKPDMVHSITPKAGLLSMLAAKMAGIPIRIHTFTGLIWPTRSGVMRRLLMTMDRLLCWAATNIYPEGKGVRHDLIRFNITSKPLKIIANGNINGVDTERFNPKSICPKVRNKLRRELGIRPNEFIFLFVGRIVTDKGVNELVQAFHRLSLNKSQSISSHCCEGVISHLVIVGNYENRLDPLHAKTEEHIIKNPYIHMVGYRPNIEDYFAIADVLTLPSYREGFPNVVLQAGAMQLNSIVSDVNGCNEIIKNGVNGWIVPAKSVEELENKMLWCIMHRKESRDMGRISRKIIIEKYECRLVWTELLKEYLILSEGKI